MSVNVTVRSKVADYQDLVPFFYLRITGLPFYIFATVNPSDSQYGSFAWIAPTGFPSTWAQRGLQLPDDTIEQKFTDIIGGVASPARCRLSVIDFPDPVHQGFGYFSRLFAAGRTLTDSSIPNGLLANRVSAAPGVDSVIEVNGTNVTWPNNADVYLGAETIGTGTNTDLTGGAWELAIVDRNKYVCFGNSKDGGTYWPPTPYHRTGVDSSNAAVPATSPTVAGDVMDVLGRTAALWMGHMRPDGNPEPEINSACLLLGRVGGLEIGKVGGMFDITIDSITGDLSKALIAPDLAQATISPAIYLNDSAWCSFYLITETSDGTKTITVPTGSYTAQSLAAQVNTQIAAAFSAANNNFSLQLVSADAGVSFQFGATQKGISFSVASVPGLGFGASSQLSPSIQPSPTSLLYALGFDPSTIIIDANATATTYAAATAPRAAASVFIPTSTGGTRSTITLIEPYAAGYFFSDQQDGTGRAWARLSSGNIIQVVSSLGGAANQIVTGQSLTGSASLTGSDSSVPGFYQFYYVEPGTPATISQVIVSNTIFQAAPTMTHLLGSLLGSTTGHTADGDLNMFPEGVGLGWFKLLTSADWSVIDESGILRITYIDATSSFADLFTPYARQHGLFIVWDPSAGSIRLRRFQIPTQAGATPLGAANTVGTTNVSFTESNRAKEGDRTTQRADRSSLRTSWKIQQAFSINTNDKPQPLVIVDIRARSMYPNDARQEEINDKTLVAYPDLGPIITRLLRLYGAPWTLCQRTMNKRGMLLAPGTIHQVIDSTMVNPFTGATGITSASAVYCFLTRVAVNPSMGAVTIEFAINSSDDQSLYRQWSPTALVDFNLNTGGYTNGYNSGTKQLSTVQHYGPVVSGDGAAFVAGDKIRVIQRDNAQTATAERTDTVLSVSGGVLTLTTGISALSTVGDSVVILQKYNSATTDRQTGTNRVSWQGDGATRTIQGNATARLNRWA